MKRFLLYFITFFKIFTAHSQTAELFSEIADQYCQKYTELVKKNPFFYDSYSILNETDTLILHTINNPSFAKLWATMPNDTASRKYISRKIIAHLIDNCHFFRQSEKLVFTDSVNIKYYEAINTAVCKCYSEKENRLAQEGRSDWAKDLYLPCVTGVLKKSEALVGLLKERQVDVNSISFLSQIESYSFDNCPMYKEKWITSLAEKGRVYFLISRIGNRESKGRVQNNIYSTNLVFLINDFVDKQAYDNALINIKNFKNNVKSYKYYFTDYSERIYWGSIEYYWFEYRNKRPFFLGKLSFIAHTDYGSYDQKVKELCFTGRNSFKELDIRKFENEFASMHKDAPPPPPKILLPAFPK
ncbi:hypothetical protein [Runella sp. SP2]|uniref:hypothetical protein n=1 Tax=Runella sp. SP2 TaxID=2268026 RepID=UPI000F084324|nr:hypothetical protein [Runella sp. SP2]AYQ35434.1 hypothetical protein DTQ70_26165 [Runella sp. SP2]